MLVADSGSFKDPTSRVYHYQGRILRGLNTHGAEIYSAAEQTAFFAQWMQSGKIARSWRVEDEQNAAILKDGWAAAIEHQRVPFISYPYEWPFAMLKDAALLHLDLLAESMKNNWTLKDATPYNIQWQGAQPLFIDIPSLQPHTAGEPWVGYRQFCMTFLFPLMLRAHLNINYAPLLRSELDGIAAADIRPYFSGRHIFKKGVLPHVVFPAIAEAAAIKNKATKPADKSPGKKQSEAIIMGLIYGMQNTVQKLHRPTKQTTWSDYETTHSYNDDDVTAKENFVRKHVSSQKRNLVWDLGCNAGAYSAICAEHADYVVSVDGDEEAIERLYLSQKQRGENKILPLTMNLANISPSQGWAGKERSAFDKRQQPQFIICLALVHHLRISANIPLDLILDWLRQTDAQIIIEFVGRDDDMTKRLLQNKDETYDDYNLENFDSAVRRRFIVEDEAMLKDGTRKLYFLHPRQ
ncbi:MAG: methyltransferase [Gammaproteobacteria bacterium WSBS_2016_MAG_OTU1]